jgi:hypothetical protein
MLQKATNTMNNLLARHIPFLKVSDNSRMDQRQQAIFPEESPPIPEVQGAVVGPRPWTSEMEYQNP